MHILWGQLSVIFTTREVLLRRMGWKGPGEHELGQIAAVMEDMVQRQFAA